MERTNAEIWIARTRNPCWSPSLRRLLPWAPTGESQAWTETQVTVRRRDSLSTVRVHAVMSEQMSDEAIELFLDRQMAEFMVENWNRDESDRAGELHVEPVELEASPN